LSTQPSAHLNFEPVDALTGAAETASSPAAALREQVAARLAAHRARRGASTGGAPKQAATGPHVNAQPKTPTGKSARVAAAVAARYANAQSYREFLAAEAEEALRRAEAAAEVAARNAEAIAAAQQELLREIAQWNGTSAAPEEIASQEIAAPPTLELVQAREEAEEAMEPAVLSYADAPEAMEAEPVAAFEPIFGPISEPIEEHAARETVDLPAFALEAQEPLAPLPLPANLIEFPRVLVAPRKARPRLAEGPLRDDKDTSQLRIFEVDAAALSPQPAQTAAMPHWSSIRLDAAVPQHAQEHPQTPAAYTMPIHTAALRPRLAAFAVDTALAAAATAAFAGVFLAMAHRAGMMPEKKAAAVAMVAVLLLFKLIYQILFFTLNEATPGMRRARIALCTFGDENPTRSAMRRRIGATVLAACPMGLGLIWSWFDDDRLGWHDRMTRTYQRSY